MATQERGELRCLVDAGLNPMQALRAGTQGAAQCLALEREVGTLEKGRLADLIVVHGNPLNDITVLLEPGHIEAMLKAVPWPWTGARKRRDDGTPSLEAALPRHLPRDVEDLEQGLPVTDASSGAI